MAPRYRYWIKGINRMVNVEFLDFSHRMLIGKGQEIGLTEPIIFDDTFLMQSTGMLDKNSVDIFEGDVVVVLDSIYTVFYDDKTASFRLKPHDKRWNTDYMSNYAHDDSFEVVGNIYENPELLEVTNDQT